MESNKTRREAALLVLVVFLLGALLGGLGNHLWGERVWGRQNPPGWPTRDQLVKNLTRELQLHAHQHAQLGGVEAAAHEAREMHKIVNVQATRGRKAKEGRGGESEALNDLPALFARYF